MFSSFRNNLLGSRILEALSFGVLFFTKEMVAYLRATIQFDVGELLTLILAMIVMSLFYSFCIAIHANASKEKMKAFIEWVCCILISLAGLVPFSYSIRLGLVRFHLEHPSLSWTFLSLYFVLISAGILFYQKFLFKIYRKALLYSSPMAIIFILTLTYFSWQQFHLNRQFITKKNSHSIKRDLTLFIVFDEWDPSVIFSEENESLLPASYRWRNQSFYATQAYPPGKDTCVSILSMTLGKQVDRVEAEKGKLRAIFQGTDESVIWEDAPQVLFREIAEKGKEIGCVGGMMADYGKVFAPYIKYRSIAKAHSLWENFSDHFFRSFLLWRPEVKAGYCPMTVRFCRFTYENDLARLFDLIKRKECDFIFAHFLGGHFPCMNGCMRNCEGKRSFHYLSNLKIVDHSLDQIERLLKRENLWDSTNCIFISDHWWRTYMWQNTGLVLNDEEVNQYVSKIDHRVPLFIKLKNQNEGFEYQKETSTIFLKELVSHLVDGSLSSLESLKAFFDQKHESRSSEICKWEGLKW